MKKVVMWVLWFIALAGIGTMLAAALLSWNEIAIPGGFIGVASAFTLMIMDDEWKRNFHQRMAVEVSIKYFRQGKSRKESGFHLHMQPYKLREKH